MTIREEISPDSLPVELQADGIRVEYRDGRSVYYRGVPAKREESVRTAPGKDVHVLVTDPTETEGVLTYVNDQKTNDDILRDSGVGRVLLDTVEETTVFPGVSVENDKHRITVEANLETVDGRVFVFEENEMGERSYEIVPAGEIEGSDTSDESSESDT
ncbi:DUF5796 family protein [Halorientalis salina]|uniref:DUF5796 family protein n=1 Tax=Halorientalis salina TaxID=2932266 RepID=UPI0010AD5ABD|nr:DUF5796 family protein [Halorientalis salina]